MSAPTLDRIDHIAADETALDGLRVEGKSHLISGRTNSPRKMSRCDDSCRFSPCIAMMLVPNFGTRSTIRAPAPSKGGGGSMRSLIIAQGGGPTAVINQTLCGAISAARRLDSSLRILGAR